jgi:hypothetical protein
MHGIRPSRAANDNRRCAFIVRASWPFWLIVLTLRFEILLIINTV